MKRRHFLGYLLLFLVGCTGVQTANGDRLDRQKLPDPEQLRFAVTDVRGLEKLTENYDNFRQSLATVLGVPITFIPVENMSDAVLALQSNRVDLVLAGPSEYVAIRSRTNAIGAIAITRPNYYSTIAVPDDSPIRSLSDLKGKTLALSDIGSTSGHLGPTKMLIDAGLDPKTDVTLLMLGDEGSVAALKNGEVDAWGGSAVDYETFFAADSATAPQFRQIAKGPPLPSDLFILSSRFSPELVAQLRDLMSSHQDTLVQALALGESTSKYRGSQLVPTQDSDYDVIREVYQAIGQGDFIR
jgi:phosphonate transport system substrate-binding protein